MAGWLVYDPQVVVYEPRDLFELGGLIPEISRYRMQPSAASFVQR